MDEGPLAWILLAILVSAYTYKQFLVFTRDVPDEYLNEQSVIDSTRNENELAIHKSTKLDYSLGLRVGLGIRYEHYKLRNGNLYDTWELAMGHAKKDVSKLIAFGQKPITLSAINGKARQIRDLLLNLRSSLVIEEICISPELMFTDPDAFSVAIACFTMQITVHLNNSSCEIEPSDENLILVREIDGLVLKNKLAVVLNLTVSLAQSTETTFFENAYTFEKDRGIALKVSHRANHRATARTDFTQSNLVSAVASCIKSLPPQHEICTNDRIAIIQDNSSIEGIVNGLVKVLVAFVTGSELYLASDPEQGSVFRPTIISANTDVTKTMYRETTGIAKVLEYHRLYSLSCNRFSGLITKKPYPDLRLLFAHRSINTAQSPIDRGKIIASLAVHMVEEIGFFNAAGPILTSDFYDYRTFSQGVASQTRACGAVAQTNEIKLVDFDGKSGKVAVRGYNMGKAKTVLENVGETVVSPDEDGFYQLPVDARWGLDGCMYVMK
ncbi:hypothetical protein METSCH_B04380 [Metschnikowia aff. pulcherrima]|uniref:Uncharacterized protein n=1 Tax=Metschnikowia aff. pulcherrima TaxID=2163413 RepID=A0A4P6XMK0_9ASCO|nr:hypothetical protein METSCH_B04380 [Metschnikowia aff. pulcherrima]